MPTDTKNLRPGGFADAFTEIDGDAPDYEKIRMIVDSLAPFGDHAGIRVTEAGPDQAVAEIPQQPHLRNHVGTVHAGALFLAADIAAATAFVAAAAPMLSQVELLILRSSHSSFLKPANGRIRAIGTVDEREVRLLLATPVPQRLDLDAKTICYDDNDVLVAKFTFEYVVTIAT